MSRERLSSPPPRDPATDAARGTLRDALGALGNLALLAGSAKVGSKAIAGVLPDVLASAGPLRDALHTLLGSLRPYIRNSDVLKEIHEFALPLLDDLEGELATRMDEPFRTPERLGLDRFLGGLSRELDAIQSLIVKSDIRTPAELAGKKIGISRLGAIPHFTLQAIVKLYNVQGINIVQTGTTTQAITSLAQGLVDGIITSAPFTFRLIKDGYRELVSPKDFKRAGVEFLIQGLVARKSYAAKNREVVIGMIKATMEGVKQIFVDDKQAKAVLAKYTRQTDPEILDQTHRFATDIFVKDPTVTPGSIRPIVQQSTEFNLIDAKLAANTPVSAYYDNSYVEEIKRSRWLAELWK